MALHQICLAFNVVDAAISKPKGDRTGVDIAVLGATELSLYSWHLNEKFVEAPFFYTSQVIFGFRENEYSTEPLYLANQQISFLNNRALLLLQSYDTGNRLLTYKIEGNTLTYVKTTQTPSTQCIIPCLSEIESSPYICTTDGQVINLSALSDSATTTPTQRSTSVKFPHTIRKVESVHLQRKSANLKHTVNMVHPADEMIISFGLTLHGSLFADQRCIARDCTSFVVTTNHLVYTTTQHLLKFVHLAQVSGAYLSPIFQITAKSLTRP